METLRLEQTDDSPLVELDQESNRFEISGKSLPEDVMDFYNPCWTGLMSIGPIPIPKQNSTLNSYTSIPLPLN